MLCTGFILRPLSKATADSIAAARFHVQLAFAAYRGVTSEQYHTLPHTEPDDLHFNADGVHKNGSKKHDHSRLIDYPNICRLSRGKLEIFERNSMEVLDHSDLIPYRDRLSRPGRFSFPQPVTVVQTFSNCSEGLLLTGKSVCTEFRISFERSHHSSFYSQLSASEER